MSQNSPELDNLIARCRMGHNEAWDELVRQFASQVAVWLARLDYTLREQDIPDLSQMVFKKLCQTLPTYQSDKSFRSWLFLLTDCIATDDYRRRVAIKRKCPGEMLSLHAGESEGQPIVDPPDPGPGPGEAAARRDEHRLLFQALDRLGPPESRCRQVIKLIFFAGFSYEEVSCTLEMNVNTVATVLRRCLQELQEIATNVFSRKKGVGSAPNS